MNDGDESVSGIEVYELQTVLDMIMKADRAQVGVIILHAVHEYSLFRHCDTCGGFNFTPVTLESGEETERCIRCGTLDGGR